MYSVVVTAHYGNRVIEWNSELELSTYSLLTYLIKTENIAFNIGLN